MYFPHIRKQLLQIVALVMVASVGIATAQESIYQSVVHRTVWLVADDGFSVTGAVVRHGEKLVVVTNLHVVGENEEITVCLPTFKNMTPHLHILKRNDVPGLNQNVAHLDRVVKRKTTKSTRRASNKVGTKRVVPSRGDDVSDQTKPALGPRILRGIWTDPHLLKKVSHIA